jgi:hypothetical protein
MQDDSAIDAVVLCVNNSTDGTASVAQQMAPSLPFALDIVQVELAPDIAHAGTARRIAMDRAALSAGPCGTLLTTDADARVAPDWVRVNVQALAAGAEAVAGRAEIDPVGALQIPAHLHEIDAREVHYASLLQQIECLIDPDLHDPWPRHSEHSGASIAVSVAAYRRAGGIPTVRLGEDRAFFEELRRVDVRIRHEPRARVVVSARLEGRAKGGMADTMKARVQQTQEYVDGTLEHVVATIRRRRLSSIWRACWKQKDRVLGAALARVLRLPPAALNALMHGCYCGEGWAEIEMASPVLCRRPVPLTALNGQTTRAQRWLGASGHPQARAPWPSSAARRCSDGRVAIHMMSEPPAEHTLPSGTA